MSAKSEMRRLRPGQFRTTCAICGGEAIGFADVENGPHPSDPEQEPLCESCEDAQSEAWHREEAAVLARVERGEMTMTEAVAALYDL